MAKSKEQVYELLRQLSYRQSALGDKVLGLSMGGNSMAVKHADRLNEVLCYCDIIEDAYLRLVDGLPPLLTDEELDVLYSTAMELTL